MKWVIPVVCLVRNRTMAKHHILQFLNFVKRKHWGESGWRIYNVIILKWMIKQYVLYISNLCLWLEKIFSLCWIVNLFVFLWKFQTNLTNDGYPIIFPNHSSYLAVKLSKERKEKILKSVCSRFYRKMRITLLNGINKISLQILIRLFHKWNYGKRH